MIMTKELIEQAYQRGFKAGYNKAFTILNENLNLVTSEAEEKGRKEAWEAARKIMQMNIVEKNAIFGEIGRMTYSAILNLSASEAIEKLRKYEERKKQEEDAEIRIGDEVILNANSSFKPNTKAIVIANDNSTRYPYNVMVDNGDTEWVDIDAIDRKTGRKFPEIAEVLKKMKEG